MTDNGQANYRQTSHRRIDDAHHCERASARHWWLVFAALVLMLGLVNWQIYVKEQHLISGDKVFFKLAPVDPRSLMQGDYMALRFELANQIRDELEEQSITSDQEQRSLTWQSLANQQGYVIVDVDTHGVAQFAAIESTAEISQPLKAQQLRVQYRVRDGRVKFATNAFFFQEGHAKLYEAAQYGLFSVNAKGEPLLTSMYDEQLQLIEPKAREVGSE
ncbi:GDYXXLXY domain-containing protein [Shewanella sp. WXL01]|uniref:GDYXXLXY domain-containing protein n=1 Tax=Shewanella sp. WXL01 TaxID=2709721 RepID=UPI001AEC1178|nr:GDYXXLXY domain-containing protein [Shewanella sp. WXL01]